MSKKEDGWEGQDDDDWDDWGDAEEYVVEQPVASTKEERVDTEFVGVDTGGGDEIVLKETENQEIGEKSHENYSWGSMWRPWGGVVSSVISTATEGLGSITSTVSQGLTNVIGVPNPEDLARTNKAAMMKVASEEQSDEKAKDCDDSLDNKDEDVEQTVTMPPSGMSLVSGVTILGSKVLNKGLDTLEGIGKKTMDILQENDPLLMNKRKMLGLEPEKPVLSEILKEAKMESDQLETTLRELKLDKSKDMLRFDFIFENNCGYVHLEALEILSKECLIKLQSLLSSVSGKALVELQETLTEVKELVEMEDMEGESDGDYDANELERQLAEAVEDLDVAISFSDIVAKWSEAVKWIAESPNEVEADEIFAKGVTMLAETSALQVYKLHKVAELIIVKEHHSTANEVDSVVQLCRQFCLHLNGVANRFASALGTNHSDDAKNLMNALFAEMYLAKQEIERAFKSFLPILQIGAV